MMASIEAINHGIRPMSIIKRIFTRPRNNPPTKSVEEHPNFWMYQ